MTPKRSKRCATPPAPAPGPSPGSRDADLAPRANTRVRNLARRPVSLRRGAAPEHAPVQLAAEVQLSQLAETADRRAGNDHDR